MNIKTQAILAYLQSLPGRGVIAGQFGSYGAGQTVIRAEARLERIFKLTGKRPALTGMDYHRDDLTLEESVAQANSFLMDKWKQGYLVTVSWHAHNPFNGKKPNDGARVGHDRLGELIDPRTSVYQTWMDTIDTIVDGLYTLKQAGITVLWRPFHEMNGSWFWWGGASDTKPFVALWRHMHDYFAAKGLDNLIWVYAPNAGKRVMDFYPGISRVDVVGIDKYLPVGASLDLNKDREYDSLIASGKPLMLTEFGNRPATGEGWDSFSYDWRQFWTDLRTNYPLCIGFMAWEQVWEFGYKYDSGQSELMHDAAAITLDALPDWSGYTPPDPPPPAPGITEADVRRIAAEEARKVLLDVLLPDEFHEVITLHTQVSEAHARLAQIYGAALARAQT